LDREDRGRDKGGNREDKETRARSEGEMRDGGMVKEREEGVGRGLRDKGITRGEGGRGPIGMKEFRDKFRSIIKFKGERMTKDFGIREFKGFKSKRV